jgi:hypothetical protein
MRNTAAWPSFKRVFTGDKRCHRAFLCCGDRIATIHDHRAASPILAGSPLIGRAVQKFFDVRHLKSIFTTKKRDFDHLKSALLDFEHIFRG